MYHESLNSRHPEVKRNHALRILKGVGKAAYTLFYVPEHDYSKSCDVSKMLESSPQPLQPSLETESMKVRDLLASPEITSSTKLDRIELLGLTGVLMQFTSYLPELRPDAETPFSHVESLYQAIVQAGEESPLDFSDQLEIALGQTEDDLPEALWRLFITSRLYARWYDTAIITDIPDMDREEIIKRMSLFSRSIAACKEYRVSDAQDTSGDMYYCWTHALGKVAYAVGASRNGIPERVGEQILHNGTTLMHKLAHRFKKQHLPSNHEVAAAYGNAIGQQCVARLLDPSDTSTSREYSAL